MHYHKLIIYQSCISSHLFDLTPSKKKLSYAFNRDFRKQKARFMFLNQAFSGCCKIVVLFSKCALYCGALNQSRTMTSSLPWILCSVKSCALLRKITLLRCSQICICSVPCFSLLNQPCSNQASDLEKAFFIWLLSSKRTLSNVSAVSFFNISAIS